MPKITRELTPNEEKALGFIELHQAETGKSPTVRQVAAFMDWQSPATAIGILRAIEKKGRIRRKGRDLEILTAGVPA